MSPVDFGLQSGDYARHRPGPPPAFYDRIDAILPLAGARVLDLATGPGVLALELAERGARVVGIDLAPPQIEAARAAAAERGLSDRTGFRVARAEDTGLDGDVFDLVTAGQCWHWFDPEAALREVRRVLRPGGVLAIVAYSYLAPHSPVAAATEELVLELNPSWTMAGWTGLFPHQIDEVIRGGMVFVESFCFDVVVPFTHERWRGRMRTCNGVGSGGMSGERVVRFDEALQEMLSERFPEPLEIPHRVWCVVGREPPSGHAPPVRRRTSTSGFR